MASKQLTGWFAQFHRGVAVDLCCGLGGISLGLRALGFYIGHAYDSSPEAVAIYNHNLTESTATQLDLLSQKALQRVASDCAKLGGVDLLAAGPPCQGFSQIRNGYHHLELLQRYNRVLSIIPEYVAVLRPRIVFIENVPDLMRHRTGATLRDLLSRLEHPGPRGLQYRIEFGVFDAALYGVPQARRRLIVLCVRSSLGKRHLPEPGPDLTRFYSAIRYGRPIPPGTERYLSMLEDPEDLTMTEPQQALSDIPQLGPGEPEVPRSYASPPATAFQRFIRSRAGEQLYDTQTPAVRSKTAERLRFIPPGGSVRDIPAYLLNGLSRRFGSAYRRLHPRAPSTTLSTKYDCVFHYSEHRALSVREYARLQGIPDFVTFPKTLVSRRAAYAMIGNAVPPLLVIGILQKVLQNGEC